MRPNLNVQGSSFFLSWGKQRTCLTWERGKPPVGLSIMQLTASALRFSCGDALPLASRWISETPSVEAKGLGAGDRAILSRARSLRTHFSSLSLPPWPGLASSEMLNANPRNRLLEIKAANPTAQPREQGMGVGVISPVWSCSHLEMVAWHVSSRPCLWPILPD